MFSRLTCLYRLSVTYSGVQNMRKRLSINHVTLFSFRHIHLTYSFEPSYSRHCKHCCGSNIVVVVTLLENVKDVQLSLTFCYVTYGNLVLG